MESLLLFFEQMPPWQKVAWVTSVAAVAWTGASFALPFQRSRSLDRD